VSQVEVHVVETNEKQGVVERRTDRKETTRKSQKIAENRRKSQKSSGKKYQR
jgi:hypothetical protein